MVDTKDYTRQGKYRLKDGSPVPTVTSITGQLDKPALVRWANRLGLQGIDTERYVDHAATVGTVAHRLVEARWNEEDVLAVEQDLIEQHGTEAVMQAQPSIHAYDRWAQSQQLEPMLVEAALVSETYRYGGTVDCLAYLNGAQTVIDLKTGSGVYPDYLIQIAAYVHAAEEMYGLNIEQGVVVNIPKNPRHRLKVGYATRDDIEIGWKVFQRLLELYYLRVGLKFKTVFGDK